MVNDCYPPKEGKTDAIQAQSRSVSYESFASGIRSRGMDRFEAGGPRIVVDTTDFTMMDGEELLGRIMRCIETAG